MLAFAEKHDTPRTYCNIDQQFVLLPLLDGFSASLNLLCDPSSLFGFMALLTMICGFSLRRTRASRKYSP